MDVAVGDPSGECHLNGLLVGGGGMSYFAGGGSGHIKHVKTTVQHDTNIKLEVAGSFFLNIFEKLKVNASTVTK